MIFEKRIPFDILSSCLIISISVLFCPNESANGASVTANWIGGAGNWSDPTHWDIGTVPNNSGDATYSVVIDLAGTDPVIDVDLNVTISNLISSEAVQVTADHALTVIGDVTNTGRLSASGGTLRFSGATVTNTNRTITADGGLVEVANSAITGGSLKATDNAASIVQFVGGVTQNNVTWEDPGVGVFRIHATSAQFLGDYGHKLPAGYTLVVSAQWGNAGSLELAGGEFRNDGLIELYRDWAQSVISLGPDTTLSGSGEVVLGDCRIVGGNGALLTVGADQTIRGNGAIESDVLNHGVIAADVAGGTLTVVGSVQSDGTIRCIDEASMTLSDGLTDTGILNFSGGGTLTLSGTVSSISDLTAPAGSTLHLSGATVANAGHTVTADGGTVMITGSTINGGSLLATDNAASFVQFAGDVTLNGVPWEDPGAGVFRIHATSAQFLGDYGHKLPAGYTLVVSAQWGNAGSLELAGGEFRNDGLIELYRDWAQSVLSLGPDTTLSGSGEVVLGDCRIVGGNGTPLTVGPDQTIRGYGAIDLDVQNHGVIRSTAGGNMTVTGSVQNHGVIRSAAGGNMTATGSVDSDGTILCIDGGNLTLSDGLTDTGILNFSGVGTLTLSGSVSSISDLTAPAGSTLHLSGATVANAGHTLTADGGTVMITGSTINGGSLLATDNAASFVQFAGDVTLNGVPWEDPGAGVFRIHATSAQFLGDYAHKLPAGYTLVVSAQAGNAGSLVLGGGEFRNDGLIELYRDWAQSVLSLGPDTTLSGSGEIVLADCRIAAGKGTPLTVGPNQTIRGNGSIEVPVVNHGLIESNVSGGTLTVTKWVRNDGVIRCIDGANLTLSRGVTNTGAIHLAGGALTLNEALGNVDLVASSGSTLYISEATVANTGRAIVADGGTVVIANSRVDGGVLRATDNAASFVKFSGDVMLNGVTWDDPGAGEFGVYNTTARLLGDYEHQLPAGYELKVWSAYNGYSQLTLSGGLFTNDGTIILTGVAYGRTVLNLESDTTLAGSGDIDMKPWTFYRNDILGAEGVKLTVGSNQRVHGCGSFLLDLTNEGMIESDLAGNTITFANMTENTGIIRGTGGGNLTFSNGLTNTGTLGIADGGTLALSGAVSPGMGLTATSSLRFSNAIVANDGYTITADGGNVEIIDSTINGGKLLATDDANSRVKFSGDVTLNGVTWDDPGAGEFGVYNTTAHLFGDYEHQLPAGYELKVWSAYNGYSQLTLSGGLFTNDGTIILTGVAYGRTVLYLESDTTLAGSGDIDMKPWTFYRNDILGAEGVKLTVGANQRVHGCGSFLLDLTNEGTIESDLAGNTITFGNVTENAGIIRGTGGGNLTFSKGVTNTGTVEAAGGSTADVNGNLDINGLGVILSGGSGLMTVSGNSTGNTSNADQYAPLGALRIDGAGADSAPQLLEVMGEDRGADAAGFTKNFAYGTLALSNNTYVRLVDNSDNVAGPGAEALYVDSLIAPGGTTLDLNGLHLYAKTAQTDGTIIGGSIVQMPQGSSTAGGESPPFTDQTPPNAGAISIVDRGAFDDHPGFTGNTSLELRLMAADDQSGVSKMRFALDGVNWSAWLDYAATYSGLDVSDGGYGLKTVYAQFRDAAGNIQETTAMDNTVYAHITRVGRGAARSFHFQDADGDSVTVKTKHCWAEVVLANGRNTGADIGWLVTHDVAPESKLIVSASGDTAIGYLGFVDSRGMGSIKLNADLAGPRISVPGELRSFKINGKLRADLAVEGELKRFTADAVDEGVRIEADGVRRFTVREAFNGALLSSGDIRVITAKTISGAAIYAAGNIGAFTCKEAMENSYAAAGVNRGGHRLPSAPTDAVNNVWRGTGQDAAVDGNVWRLRIGRMVASVVAAGITPGPDGSLGTIDGRMASDNDAGHGKIGAVSIGETEGVNTIAAAEQIKNAKLQGHRARCSLDGPGRDDLVWVEGHAVIK